MAAATEAYTTAGSSLAVSAAAPTANTKTAYMALSFTPIGEIDDLGTIGRTYNNVAFNPISSRATRNIKGSFSDGTQAVKMAKASGDPGQVIIAAGLDDDAFYSFKLTEQDGTIQFYRAQISSAPNEYGGVDAITSKTVNLTLKSGTLIEIPPA
jgi:hypothetical protein